MRFRGVAHVEVGQNSGVLLVRNKPGSHGTHSLRSDSTKKNQSPLPAFAPEKAKVICLVSASILLLGNEP